MSSKRTNEELLELAQRAQAELINHKNNQAKLLKEQTIRSENKVLLDLISLLDAVESGLQHHPDFEPVVKLFYSKLKSYEVKEIATEKFDPSFHEALSLEASDVPVGEIIEVTRKGYVRHGLLLRASGVIISS